VWDTRGIPLRYVVLVGAMMLLVSQLGSPWLLRFVDDAFSSGDRHARLTRAEAVEKATARVNGYFDAHDRGATRVRGRLVVLRAEPASGFVRGWCRDCSHWLVEVAHRVAGQDDERFCIAVTQHYSIFSSACSRWMPPAEAPPRTLVSAARSTARPALGSRRGLLLFQRRHGKTADLHSLDIAAGRVRRLTSTPEHEFSPSWSPDGTRIAFARNLGGSEHDVFVMRSDGSGVVRLTDSPGPDDQPAWLPDGRLAFRSVRDGVGSVYVLDPSRPEVPAERVLERTSSADWSPNGEAITFSAAIEYGFDVWLTDAGRQQRWNLTSTLHEDAYDPRWSPDGQRIAFATTNGIYVMRADGRGRRRIVSRPHELAVAWSPDGSVAWVGQLENGGIYVTSTRTGRTSRLTANRWDLGPDWR
jgi:dipeptidyl aminopeptidase/acylaminoacyl peptidase